MKISRLVFVISAFLFLWLIVVAKAFYVQVFPNERLAQLKRQQFEKTILFPGHRGAILDRHGRELAISIAAHSLFADPGMIKNKSTAAIKLAAILKMPVKEISGKLNRKTRFQWLARRLDQETKKKIDALKINGLGFTEEPQRVYPFGNLAADTLGLVGDDQRGLEGLEKQYDKVLGGQARERHILRDARGNVLFMDGGVFNNAPDGQDLQLTLDLEWQHQLEQELEEATKKWQALGAFGVILHAKTNEVLALGSWPVNARRNRIISDMFEPGSVIKPIMAMGALESGLYKPNSEIDCRPNTLRVNKHTIREADAHHQFGMLTISEVIANSSNIGAARISLEMGDKNGRATLTDFRIGEKTGIDFPGEAKGLLPALPWKPLTTATIGYGHGVAATPLQIATAYSIIANQGKFIPPRLATSANHALNRESLEFKAQEGKQIVPTAIADQMRFMLAASTSTSATGVLAKVAGFPIAGKTGTALRVEAGKKGYNSGYISSFVGMIPANDPEYVIYVGVDQPKGEIYGSKIAAPIFSNLAGYMMRMQAKSPIVVAASKKPSLPNFTKKEISPTVTPGSMPFLKGMSLRNALRELQPVANKVEVQGNGWIEKTVPAAGQPVQANGKVLLILTNNADRVL